MTLITTVQAEGFPVTVTDQPSLFTAAQKLSSAGVSYPVTIALDTTALTPHQLLNIFAVLHKSWSHLNYLLDTAAAPTPRSVWHSMSVKDGSAQFHVELEAFAVENLCNDQIKTSFGAETKLLQFTAACSCEIAASMLIRFANLVEWATLTPIKLTSPKPFRWKVFNQISKHRKFDVLIPTSVVAAS